MIFHPGKASPDLKSHLEQVRRAHEIEVTVFESGFDPTQIEVQFREFLFVSWEKHLVELFELELLEPEDLVLMFSVPIPKGGFGDVDFESDGGKAPAVGAQGDEGGKFG